MLEGSFCALGFDGAVHIFMLVWMGVGRYQRELPGPRIYFLPSFAFRVCTDIYAEYISANPSTYHQLAMPQ